MDYSYDRASSHTHTHSVNVKKEHLPSIVADRLARDKMMDVKARQNPYKSTPPFRH
jgi:hypothetical protein